MTKITFALAATIASLSFTAAALAQEGTYYNGAQPKPQSGTGQTMAVDSYGYTGSIGQPQEGDQLINGKATLNSGDYYEGAVRPH